MNTGALEEAGPEEEAEGEEEEEEEEDKKIFLVKTAAFIQSNMFTKIIF